MHFSAYRPLPLPVSGRTGICRTAVQQQYSLYKPLTAYHAASDAVAMQRTQETTGTHIPVPGSTISQAAATRTCLSTIPRSSTDVSFKHHHHCLLRPEHDAYGLLLKTVMRIHILHCPRMYNLHSLTPAFPSGAAGCSLITELSYSALASRLLNQWVPHSAVVKDLGGVLFHRLQTANNRELRSGQRISSKR